MAKAKKEEAETIQTPPSLKAVVQQLGTPKTTPAPAPKVHKIYPDGTERIDS